MVQKIKKNAGKYCKYVLRNATDFTVVFEGGCGDFDYSKKYACIQPFEMDIFTAKGSGNRELSGGLKFAIYIGNHFWTFVIVRIISSCFSVEVYENSY